MVTTPRYYKGDILTPTADAIKYRESGSRRSTQAEAEAWYAHAHANWGPHDSAGESWVHSGTTYVTLTEGQRLLVTRGACTAHVGWNTRNGYCEVTDLDTNQTFKVDRRWLRRAA